MALSPAAVATLSRLENFGMRLGLESTLGLLRAMGSPQSTFPAVVVAGTNGKGSTSVLLASIAHHAGLRAGLYTSPHLESPEERVRVAGRVLPADELSALLLEVVATAERVLGAPPTYFEAFTVAALCAFARRAVDLAVLEVGIGGRLDATNATEPVLAVITPIGLDHQEHLGMTLAAIAREKAGIMRPGRPAVAWVPAREAREALAAAAAQGGTPLEFAHETTTVEELASEGWNGQRLVVRTPQQSYELRAALLGEHQLANIALAVRAAERLRELGWSGFSALAMARGVAAARWPGRLEPVLLPDGRRVVLDGAHNPDGVAALTHFLDRLGAPVDLLFGALADKDLAHMLPPLAARARAIVLTAPRSPRAERPQELLALLGGRQAIVEPDLATALARALAEAPNDGAPLVICGSLYLVGAARLLLRERFGVPAAATGDLFA